LKPNTAVNRETQAEQAPAASNALTMVNELIELAPKTVTDFEVMRRYDSQEIATRFVGMRDKLLALREAIETELG
jgi:hypothetical protein